MKKYPKTAMFILILLLLAVLSGCGGRPEEEEREREREKPPKGTAQSTLDRTLSALADGGGEDAPILSLDGTPTEGFANEGLARTISRQLRYEIQEVTEKGDDALATVKITAPDVPSLLEEILEDMDEYDEAAFTARMEEALAKDPPTAEFIVEVALEYRDGVWYLVPNGELSNAMTGGLLELYAGQIREIQNTLTGGDAT